MSMNDEEREFWGRVSEYESRFRQNDYVGSAITMALALRRESQDVFSDLAENADYAADTDDTADYIRWLQRAEEDVAYRITQATATALTDEVAEANLSFAYGILREVCTDALTRRPLT